MPTKLLLIEDVEDLGRCGDIVSVKPGYARNFLVPQHRAVVATKGTIRRQERLQAERQKRADEDRKTAEAEAAKLETVTLEIQTKLDPEGHMYGSVTALEIANHFKEKAGFEIEKRAIVLKQPIKKIGVHTIEVKLKEGVMGSFTLKIIPEEGEPEA